MPKKCRRRGGAKRSPQSSLTSETMPASATSAAAQPQTVDEIYASYGHLDESAELWPYEKRFDLLQTSHIDFQRAFNSRDANASMNAALSLLDMPYYKIGDLRSCLMIIIMGIFCSGLCKLPCFSCYEERLCDLLKVISHDKKEHPCTRILALMNRALDPTIPTSSFANYIRRALQIAKTELEAIVKYPQNINILDADGVTRNVSPMSSRSPQQKFSPAFRSICAPEHVRRSVMFRFLNDFSFQLQAHEGRPIGDIKSFDSYVVGCYAASVGGGCCDCCGKNPEKEGLAMLFKCKQCRLAYYCSPTCQSRCWSGGHADHCKTFGRFEIGNMVVLQKLKSAIELNNHVGQIESRAPSGRWVVRLAHPKHVKRGPISVKPENIRHPRPLK